MILFKKTEYEHISVIEEEPSRPEYSGHGGISVVNRNKLAFIDNLRALATMFVLMWHFGFVFWYRNAAVADLCHIDERANIVQTVPKIYDDIANVISKLNLDFGMMGVAIFFLISGFIIPYSVRNMGGGENKCLFLLKRFLRIYPVYILGFGITFLIIQCYGLVSGGRWVYSAKDYVVQASLLRDWFWVPSIDGISWTLEIEIKFYVLFFFMFVLKCEDNPKVISGIAFTACIMSILCNANSSKLLEIGRNNYIICNIIANSMMYIIFILMGLGIYQLYVGQWDRKVWIVVEEVLLICFFVSVFFGTSSQLGNKFVVNYGSAFLLFVNAYALRNTTTQNRVFRFFAQNSFAIYLLHGVNGYIMLTIFYDLGMPMYINLPIVIGIVLFVSFLFRRYVEQPIGYLSQKYIISCFQK